MTLPPDDPPHTVKPRKRKHTHRPIIVVTSDELLIEETGLVLPSDQLPHVLLTVPSSIIACQGFGGHLDLLRKTFGSRDDFQYRVTPRFVPSRNQDAQEITPVTQIHDAVVNFVGFRGIEHGNYKSGKRWTRYHYPIDPIHFVRESIDTIYPKGQSRLNNLLLFAQEVREFCKEQLLEIKPSAGGLAAQLLRDPRFYPKARRKAPRIINDIARPHLPGNFYRLHCDESPRKYDAAYLDLSGAHHEMAKQVVFPHADDLHAYGRWGEEIPSKPFVDIETRRVHPILTRPGLFHLRIKVPKIRRAQFPLPFMETPGVKDIWAYSNELELIEELGGEIISVFTAIVSSVPDPGLNRYAEWALDQLAARPERKPWLKPTLHAAYGILAARPAPFETGYFRAEGSKLVNTDYPLGKWSVPVRARRSKKPIETSIVNVIHRGMIEAELRATVLRFARKLTEDKRNVLAVYADSLFVEGDQMPILPRPWRVAELCTNLRFLSSTHFVSDQENRLPGIPRNRRDAAMRDRLIRREILISSVVPTKQPIRLGG